MYAVSVTGEVGQNIVYIFLFIFHRFSVVCFCAVRPDISVICNFIVANCKIIVYRVCQKSRCTLKHCNFPNFWCRNILKHGNSHIGTSCCQLKNRLTQIRVRCVSANDVHCVLKSKWPAKCVQPLVDCLVKQPRCFLVHAQQERPLPEARSVEPVLSSFLIRSFNVLFFCLLDADFRIICKIFQLFASLKRFVKYLSFAVKGTIIVCN